MSAAMFHNDDKEREKDSADFSSHDAMPEEAPAWELIDVGRYMPRRIRGSFRGRELG